MDVKNLFEGFKRKKLLVIGDVMLDRYMIGSVSRISPEAPVPIIELIKEEDRLGGAANVALNVVALGSEVHLGAVVGNDNYGDKIKELCFNAKIGSSSIITLNSRPTTVKTRILGNKQQLLRVDSEVTSYLTLEEENIVKDQLLELLNEGFDAIIFEDYNKGLLTENIIQAVIEKANEKNILTAVDPKKKHFFSYKGVTLFKPNLKELREGLDIIIDFPTDKFNFEKAIGILNQRISNAITFITLSEHGVAISDHKKVEYFQAHLRNIADVSGAGDTVIAVATLCLVSGCSLHEIAKISNLAGGLVCEKSGVVSIELNELKEEVEKLFSSYHVT